MSHMTPAEYQRIRKILESALARPPEQRGAHVKEQCGSDVALQKEVESLLAQDGDGSFLDPAKLDPAGAMRPSPAPGTP